MTFADLEQRTNAAVMRRLSNARALPVGGSADFPVIFDVGQLLTSTGASAAQPLATALDSDVSTLTANVSQLQIRSVTYTVRDLQPDGTGMTVVLLEVG